MKSGTIIIHTKYCLELLKKNDMKNLKIISTHMVSNVLIDEDETGIEIKITKYQGIIVYLL